MGTSASNSGPKDKTPLLPAWAQQAAPEGTPAEPAAPIPAPAAPDVKSPSADPAAPSSDPSLPAIVARPRVNSPVLPSITSAPWKLARRAMTSAAKNGGTSRRLRLAGRRYVSAKGGAEKSASTAAAGRAATARIGNFISDVSARGFTDAARAVGLQNTVGQKVDVVLAAVINAIAPPGTNNDDAIARRAASETLREVFEKYGVEESGLDALNAMTPDDVAETIELSVAAYVYQRWLFDLSQRIEQNAVSETDAVRLERDVKTFVAGLVKLKLDGNQALQVDWNGVQGKKFVQDIYEAAYKLLGGTS